MLIYQTRPRKTLSTIRTWKSDLKNDIFLALQHRFLAEKKKGNEPLEEFIQSLSDQISTLKREINFVREELKEKGHVI